MARVLVFVRQGRVTGVEVDTELAPESVTVLYTDSGTDQTVTEPRLVTDLGGESWWQADFD